MCKHILNTQAYLQAPCCLKWVECSECHDEIESHPLQHSSKLRFCCKNCKTCFIREFSLFSEKDKLCNNCKVCWVIPGITPESRVLEETSVILQHFADDVLRADQPFFQDLDQTSSEDLSTAYSTAYPMSLS
mmetsp:Transcript_5479/g.5645  ORF Transcript_5479/g.5645 Transcript_5479/m.5645 type:complete len:132 (-) Transcript_5479:181-576(-)